MIVQKVQSSSHQKPNVSFAPGRKIIEDGAGTRSKKPSVSVHAHSGFRPKHRLITVGINRIDLFQRTPTDLKRYVEFVHYLKKAFGSVLQFIHHERLHWSSTQPSGQRPFENPSDYKVLYNDWPYGIDLDIVHLVVWTKFAFQDDPVTGDLTPESRAMIEAFVQKTFCGKNGSSHDNTIWFRNWKSLKSVQALEHFHVMLYKPDPEFLRKITGGDMAMAEKLRVGKS
jgi:Protein of unknown function (DUF3605)